ncbi:MAG: hypothetical protein LC627_05745, partial [Verrucomicrobiaceae bacterium]|nr:hypothetical protein [Verrucomicrobiaceae bacterium]
DVFAAFNDPVPHISSLTLSDAGFFSFSNAFSWIDMTAPGFLPELPAAVPQQQKVNVAYSVASNADSSKEPVEVRRSSLLDYVHGEVGFLYGRSSGKFGGDYKQGYIIGETGDDKFHIVVGAAYEDSSRKLPRLRP